MSGIHFIDPRGVLSTIAVTALGFVVHGVHALAAEPDDMAWFEAKIRPLLVERCYECHSEKKQKGGLRLDSKAAWQKGGDDGAVIVPGNPEDSLIIKAVRYGDPDLQMPPKTQLTPEEIAALERWIKIGAPDPRAAEPAKARTIDFEAGRKQWAFQLVGHPSVPELEHDDWSRDAIDRFILARLRQAELQPSPRADRRTLIRRATFDLTGLPPTNEEVAAFERDNAPDAFAKVVDRLLASPQYGEHWARHWLDIARYSDTKGYVYAREEKNWVHAWAYRDWVVRALNADLPYDRFLLLQLAADQVEPPHSPNLAAMGFLTVGRRFLGVTHDIIDDRIDAVMRGLQGLTVACARCHDHKFDPISTRDYYALYGVFKSSAEQVVRCDQPVVVSPDFETELRVREDKLRDTMVKRREEQAARVRATVSEHLIAQLELEKYPEETFGQILGPEDINPDFVRRWQNYLRAAEQRHDPVFSEWNEAAHLDPTLRRKVAKHYGARFAEVDKKWRDLLKESPSAQALPNAQEETWRRVLYGPDSPCTVPDESIVNIEMFFPTKVTEELWKLQGEVDRWIVQSKEEPVFSTILVDRTTPVIPRVFKRGNPLTKGEEVPRRFLQVLTGDQPTPFTHGSGRLELAQAIIDPHNPLTARVMVNRVWTHHFGHGLVSTPSDFGKRADPPSHPELLDWLARTFMDEGWSLKKLHRRILLSAAYQQGSFGPADTAAVRKAQEIDPENRLLWRMNTHRLSFEEMRDAWLSATGELDLRVGGKPRELFAPANTRRTIYTFIDREHLPTVLSTFDFANPELSIPQRNDTIVPQQALFGLNHPFVAARAKRLAANLPSDDDTERLRRLYQQLYQREPTASELKLALAFVQPDGAPIVQREESKAWQYGYGEFDESAGHLKGFIALPHYNGTAWQGGEQWPDKKLGWLQLTPAGGHPGNDRRHAIVRRWVAPQDGTYDVISTLTHEPAAGDGIRAFIAHSGRGLLRSIALHHATESLNVKALSMTAGDTLDFIVDLQGGLNSNQFLWSQKIASISATGLGAGSTEWDAQKDFAGPYIEPLDRWQQLAQALLLANEFIFVD